MFALQLNGVRTDLAGLDAGYKSGSTVTAGLESGSAGAAGSKVGLAAAAGS